MCSIIWLNNRLSVCRIVSRITVEYFNIILTVWEGEADTNQRIAFTLSIISDHNEIKLKPKTKG